MALEGISIILTQQLCEFQKYTYGEWIKTFCDFYVDESLHQPLPATNSGQQGSNLAASLFDRRLIVSNIVLTVLCIVQCRPLQAAWDNTVQGNCFTRGQKERIIIAQASSLSNGPSHLIMIKGMLIIRSYICRLRFHIVCISSPYFMESADETKDKDRFMLLDGSWSHVYRIMFISK